MNSDDLGVYVHWPFCLAKCPYCDFNSHVRDSFDQDRWQQAYMTEIRTSAERVFHLRNVTSVFFGGGTPSLMNPKLVAGILDTISEFIGIVPGAEISMEANPTSAEAANFKAYRSAGVNRLSLGVQALDDAALKFLGREHSVATAMGALEAAQGSFDRVSFDLIYARPGQTVGQWSKELSRALNFGTRHVSLYQLTIEPDTKFAETYAKGGLSVLSDEIAADLFEVTQSLCNGAGLPAYEISNHATVGEECAHNMVYWRAGDWIGIGPGAHGRLTLPEGRIATTQHRSPETWLDAVENSGSGAGPESVLDPASRLEETVLMALRLTEGLSEARFVRQTGRTFDQAFGQILPDMIGDGFLELSDSALRTTARGCLLLNQIVSRLTLAS